MHKQLYVVETAKDKVMIEVEENTDKNEERMNAFAKYFSDLAKGNVDLAKVGNIIMLHEYGQSDKNKWYPFRVVPLLWKMGLIGTEHAVDNLVAVLGGSRTENKKMLQRCAEKDADLIEYIDNLAARENT